MLLRTISYMETIYFTSFRAFCYKEKKLNLSPQNTQKDTILRSKTKKDFLEGAMPNPSVSWERHSSLHNDTPRFDQSSTRSRSSVLRVRESATTNYLWPWLRHSIYALTRVNECSANSPWGKIPISYKSTHSGTIATSFDHSYICHLLLEASQLMDKK